MRLLWVYELGLVFVCCPLIRSAQLGPWLAAEVPVLVDQGIIQASQ
jgi:hypothetical protein